ncbi:PKD domain-containing protein [Chamaesiphon sp. OTE_8_metabat_110]|uniref:PKD domain-containing protein n=1 Tax=Chamaesiphon sp. OTE_8_metabat_110 TaxID=2964696 RepID=UPI0037C00295
MPQGDIAQINFFQIDSTKFSLPSSITLQQLLTSHNPNLQNTTVPAWTEFLQSPTPFNLKIEITDLPTGQLASATITGYDTNNRPNSGTLTLDTDGNSLGWFIDTTPDDNSEFDQTLTSTAFRATTGAAAGKYDLLTTILHELGHLKGIIRGNNAFDAYVQNINGISTFINSGITAHLTPDGSHLDTTFHPYDLMNTSLKPGVRKLPSALNLAMIDAINSGIGGWVSGVGTLNSANLTAGALIGITNGDFTTPTTWNTLGATNIINGTATLTEQSQKLSELTQAFIIPTGAKTLQFTIIDNHLVTGDTTKTANDAFEVALLDTNTFNPLAGTSIGLNHTDSLLNIQANGTIHKSDKVTITTLGNNSSIVTIDLTQVTPTTQATLYFNLLGFGARTSTVTIDDVKLFTDTQPIPVTKNDTLVTNQNTPLTLDPTLLTTNDTNVSQIQIINQPTHGTLTQTPDGKLTYQPVSTYVGNDSFTYLGFGTDGQISNLATVNITVNNLPPTIETVLIPNQINEGQTIQLKATAKDGGSSDNLTYTWDLGDGSQTVIGQNIVHQFVDNGTYNVVLTVTDKDGGTTQQSTQLTVDNVAPTLVVNKSINTNINQGEAITFIANYSDSGINDTHTITWNFGDGSNPVSSVNNPSHQFTKSGTHNVTVTVTDNDGASTTETIQVTVTNLAPTINTVNIPTNINEGSTVQLTATASDSGNDTLTYNWYINGATTPIIGQTIDYNFANSGSYPVKLDVIDSNGAITTQTIDVTINNLAPTINSITIPTNIKEGETVQLTATASDAGNDALTYNWYINNSTTPITGQTIDYKFLNNGIYPVRLEVIDSDGAITTQTIDVTVKNVAPTIDNITIPTNIKEGETIQLIATASDSGNDVLTYNWYINNATIPITGQTIDYIFTDNGIYPVKLEVIDTDGALTTQTVDVTVTNVAPTIVKIVKPDTIKEGEQVEFTAIATDVGINDTLTYSWNFGDNTNPTIGQIVSHTFADNGDYNVTLTVTDKDGAATTQTVAVTVANVAPVVVSILKPAKIDEGEEVEFMATATDAGVEDTLTYTWNFGDNTEQSNGKNVNHIFADNGNYNIVLTVTDKDGAVTTQTVAVTVDNVAPVVVSIVKPETIKEGESVTFSATATDPGILDTLTYSWNFGDNTNPVTGQNVTHTFADNGNYNVVLTVTDKDGGVTIQTVVAKVDNVAPTIVSIAKPTTINQNQAATFAATATDPGVLDTLTYVWNFGDNTQTATGQNAAHTFTAAGNYTITLAVTDKDGATTTTTQQITVAALPTITINDPTITEGDSGTTNLTFTLTLNQASTQAISVNYNTSNLTAISGSDYTATSGTITFAVGETTKTITIAILGDTTAEASETFALNLTNAINATIAKATGTATILDNDTIAAPTSGIRSGGTVTIKGNADLDGNINSRTDDTKIYAAVGVNFNGNSITLPVKRDAAGNPLKDTNGKIILETGEITIAPGGSTSSLSGKYSGIASATQTITIPTFTDTKQQDFLSKMPSTGVITFDLATNPIANAAAWNTKFPPAGTTLNPTVVRVINGNLNLPSGINLSNYIIIVENGNINFNSGTPVLNNVTLIASNGNIDLKSVVGTAVSLCASGNISFSGGNQLAGNWLVNSNGNTTFSGSNSMTNAASAVKIVAQGNIDISGNTSLKGQLWTKKNFSANGSTTIVGAITAMDNVDISGNSTITGV